MRFKIFRFTITIQSPIYRLGFEPDAFGRDRLVVIWQWPISIARKTPYDDIFF